VTDVPQVPFDPTAQANSIKGSIYNLTQALCRLQEETEGKEKAHKTVARYLDELSDNLSGKGHSKGYEKKG